MGSLRRIAVVGIAGVLAFGLVGCGEPVSGTVIGKEYDAAETKRTTKQKCTSKTVNGTTKRTCKTVPTTKRERAEWELTVEEADGDIREVDVSEREFSRINVGDHFTEKR